MDDCNLCMVLQEADLVEFRREFSEKLQITKLEHFDHVKESDLKSIGLSQPAIRRLNKIVKEKRNTLKKRLKKRSSPSLLLKGNDSLQSTLTDGAVYSDPPESTCLINSDDIKLMENLGEGSFGIVKRAIWAPNFGRKLDVAVKLLRNDGVSDDFMAEVSAMHSLRHRNLIRLFGFVISTKPLMLVTELCAGGALLDRLRDNNKPVLLLNQLLDYSRQISDGMAYLESKRFIHRDLATRNVLLTAENEKCVKISDFGMMRALQDKHDHYVMTNQKKLPFAWCPPEALKQRKFSNASDVWSFGVTLWEMFSYGEEPWCGYSGPEILQKISNGEMLQQPEACPLSVYDLMKQCWSLNPAYRPVFATLQGVLKAIVLHTGLCKDSQTDKELLEMNCGDSIIVADGDPNCYYWIGQNVRTGKIGKFARRLVNFDGKFSLKDISRPIRGSFVHTGHGDVKGGQSWGQPDKIDDIYLRNPLLLIDFNDNGAGCSITAVCGENKPTYDSGSFSGSTDEPSSSSGSGASFSSVPQRFYAPVAEDEDERPKPLYDDVPFEDSTNCATNITSSQSSSSIHTFNEKRPTACSGDRKVRIVSQPAFNVDVAAAEKSIENKSHVYQPIPNEDQQYSTDQVQQTITDRLQSTNLDWPTETIEEHSNEPMNGQLKGSTANKYCLPTFPIESSTKQSGLALTITQSTSSLLNTSQELSGNPSSPKRGSAFTRVSCHNNQSLIANQRPVSSTFDTGTNELASLNAQCSSGHSQASNSRSTSSTAFNKQLLRRNLNFNSPNDVVEHMTPDSYDNNKNLGDHFIIDRIPSLVDHSTSDNKVARTSQSILTINHVLPTSHALSANNTSFIDRISKTSQSVRSENHVQSKNNSNCSTKSSTNRPQAVNSLEDPFEVTPETKMVVQSTRYSQLYSNPAVSQDLVSTISNFGSTLTNQIQSFTNPWSPKKNSGVVTSPANGSSSRAVLPNVTSKTPAVLSSSSVHALNQSPKYSSNLNSSLLFVDFPDDNMNNLNISSDSNVVRVLSNPNILSDNHNVQTNLVRSPQRASFVNTGPLHTPLNTASSSPADKQVLELFDPLAQKTSKCLVDEVLSQIRFATPQRCAQMLRRFNFDVRRTVEELKIQKLVDMGLADRQKCQRILCESQWNIERAAARILD